MSNYIDDCINSFERDNMCVVTKGYLYYINNGRIKVKEGFFEPHEIDKNFGYFYYKDTNIGFIKIKDTVFNTRWCKAHPGDVYYDGLWLEDKDDDLAIRFFIEHEENRLREFAHKTKEKIKNIKKGLI